jgi:hypothetical protein
VVTRRLGRYFQLERDGFRRLRRHSCTPGFEASGHITTHIKSIIHMNSESKSTTRHDAKSPEHNPKQKSPCRIGE